MMRLILFFLLMHASLAIADVYRCKDDQGRIKFTDQSCVGEEISKKNTIISEKKYPGYKKEKYLEFSEEKRAKLCSQMKERYAQAKAKKCVIVLRNDDEKKCESGEMLEMHIQQAKKDYEFTCQI